MSTLHLAAGSKQPPKVDGKLRLYSMEYCPYAQRSRLVLKAKKIPHDIVNINLGNKPEWYFKVHPEGKVPAIDTGSEVVVESLVISDFLEEKYPAIPLYSQDPELKKRDKELIGKMDPLIMMFYKCVMNTDNKTPEEWAKELAPHLEVFQSELASRGTTFFGGSKPGMVDYMIWPWSERAPLIAISLGQKLPFPEEQFALIRKWAKAMKEDPACKATLNDVKKHLKLFQNRINKVTTDYDNL